QDRHCPGADPPGAGPTGGLIMKPSTQCSHLRSKAMFIPGLAQEGSEPDAQAAPRCSHCWCNRTLTETGPDEQPVGEEVCQPGRACFEQRSLGLLHRSEER